MAAALAQGLGEARLSAAELVDQPAKRLRFFENCQIFALQILDQRNLQCLDITEGADQHRHLVQPGALRRTPARISPTATSRTEPSPSPLLAPLRPSASPNSAARPRPSG